MGTTSLATLEQRLSEALGDWLSISTTTNITTDNYIFSTTLNQYDGSQNDYFNNWWVYIDGVTNAGVERKVKDYTTATGRLEVYGAALAAETAARTVRVYRYRQSQKLLALNRATEQMYPNVFIPIDDRTLLTGNILPDGHFEWWTSATALKLYSASSVDLAKTTTAGLYRGPRGTTSVKVTADAANGYLKLSSDTYPRLLDLMDKTVNFYCWAYPEVANDASIVIYTKQADGTAQTLTSTTTNPAGEFTRLKLESQSLNDDLVEVEIRFKVATDTKYVYFDDAQLDGINLTEYLLPESYQDGHIDHLILGGDDEEINPIFYPQDEVGDYTTIHDGTYRYLSFDALPARGYRIQLLGSKPLETLSAQTDTISTDNTGHIQMIVAYAAHLLFEMQKAGISSQDVGRYASESGYWLFKYNRLKSQFGKNIYSRPLRST